MTSREVVIFTLRSASAGRRFFRHKESYPNIHSRVEWTFSYNVESLNEGRT